MSKYEVDVHIEISSGSTIKYEIDHETKNLRVDRILHTPMVYFFNYGYILNTLGGDGDPLDAVVLCDEGIYPTSHIKCKMLGVLHTMDESGEDDKIILVPMDKIDKHSVNVNNITDISEFVKKKLIFFFDNYKKMEPKKWVKINPVFGDKDKAHKVYTNSLVHKQ
jgi:inorganic pyrophosphatase